MRTHFPPGPLLGAVIRLSFGTWIGLRLLLAAGLAWGGGGPLELALVAQLLVPRW